MAIQEYAQKREEAPLKSIVVLEAGRGMRCVGKMCEGEMRARGEYSPPRTPRPQYGKRAPYARPRV